MISTNGTARNRGYLLSGKRSVMSKMRHFQEFPELFKSITKDEEIVRVPIGGLRKVIQLYREADASIRDEKDLSDKTILLRASKLLRHFSERNQHLKFQIDKFFADNRIV